jgi:hypothetical protein
MRWVRGMRGGAIGTRLRVRGGAIGKRLGVRGGAIRGRLVAAGVALALYGVGLGFLGGVAVDRMLFDRERKAVVGRLEQASRRVHGALMELERDATER